MLRFIGGSPHAIYSGWAIARLQTLGALYGAAMDSEGDPAALAAVEAIVAALAGHKCPVNPAPRSAAQVEACMADSYRRLQELVAALRAGSRDLGPEITNLNIANGRFSEALTQFQRRL